MLIYIFFLLFSNDKQISNQRIKITQSAEINKTAAKNVDLCPDDPP